MRNDTTGPGGPDSDADLEARLADWGRLTRAATGQQPLPDLVAAPQRRDNSAGWQIAASVLVVALAAAIVVGLPRLRDKDRGPAGPLATATSTAPAGPGSQVITFHGLSITVPASWQVGGYSCGLTSSVVELPGFTTLCGRGPHPQFTIVSFHEGAPPKAGVTRSSRTTIGGLAATRFEIVPPHYGVDRTAVGYAVPELQAWVMIEPAQGQSGQELAATLRVDEVDADGCRSRVADVAELPRTPLSDRPGLAQALIPGQPVSARVCRYLAGWLEGGGTLSGTALRAFVAKVNKAPVGLSRARDPEIFKCRAPGTLGSVSGEDSTDSEAYRIEIAYPAGPPVILVARAGRCGDLGISNGARTGQRTQTLAVALAGIAGNGTGWPVPAVPAPR